MAGAKKKRKRDKAKGCSRLPCTVEPASHQTGTSNIKYDKRKKALPPGKRISRSGNVYYEYRRNRSDLTPDEIPSSVKRKLKQGLKSRKKGAVVMDHQQCIARADGMKLVLMPPSDTRHIPFAAVIIGNDEITGTYLQVRDSIGREKRDLYNRLLRKCWSHPGVKLWEILLPAKAGTWPKPHLIINTGRGTGIAFKCDRGELKPSFPDDMRELEDLVKRLSGKERETLRQALKKYEEILCKRR